MRALTRWEATAGCTGAEGAAQVAALWKAWSKYDTPMEQAVTWADVKANIVVKQVAAPVANDPWETNETSLMLMDCDSGAQCSLLRGPPPVRPLTWRDHPILTERSLGNCYCRRCRVRQRSIAKKIST